MDGLLVVDKPVGPTSHDIVTGVRRLLREPRVGHAGTLDPMASGVLVLVLGRATRLAQFMGSDEKVYEARVRLGVRTDTYDADGAVVGQPYDGPWPDAAAVENALASFVGTHDQQPPAFSAKKIGGKRSYAMARAAAGGDRPAAPLPKPVAVTMSTATVTGYDDGIVALTLTCSAGFYVRALAHDLGERLGTGAHLVGLRRTRSGTARIEDARRLADLEAAPEQAAAAVIPMSETLSHLPALVLTEAGMVRTAHGALLKPGDFTDAAALARLSGGRADGAVKLLSPSGGLVAIARPSAADPTALHPSVVLM
jgi:tRNA pseudouridine55 synthase